MNNLMICILALAGSVASISCNSESTNAYRIALPEAVQKTFKDMFPKARDIEWERSGEYYLAEFDISNNDTEAWFDESGKWYMTITDLTYFRLPEKVRQAFKASEWANWRVDDCEKIAKDGVKTVFILEIETGVNEACLIYNEEGALVKVIEEKTGRPTLPATSIVKKVNAFIDTTFPRAMILNLDFDGKGIEAEIRHDSRKKEIWFDNDGNWRKTEYDVKVSEVSQLVMNTLKASDYSSYRIDDVEYVETPSVKYYFFELKKGDAEIDLHIDSQGRIINTK